jgi:hypothetical protein
MGYALNFSFTGKTRNNVFVYTYLIMFSVSVSN